MLAKILNVYLRELDKTNWDLHEIENNDDLVTELEVKFTNSPREVLNKIGVKEGENHFYIEASAFSNAEYLYKHYAEKLDILYLELLYAETSQEGSEERNGVVGVCLKFGPDKDYEFLARIKHNGLTKDYVTWLPYPH